MKYKLNESIANDIIYAQLSSDRGKRIYEMFEYIPDAEYISKKEYSHKDYYIYDAIMTILKCKHHHSGFTFFVTQGDTTPYLVYFSYKLHGKRYQISFHSYDSRLRPFMNPQNIYMRWDHKVSRANAIKLYQELFN